MKTERVQTLNRPNLRIKQPEPDLKQMELEIEENAVTGKASPFVKWAGGKRSIINELAAHVPSKFNTFYEPFVGGGALFFHLYPLLKHAVLSDINLDLLSAYRAVQHDHERLITALKVYADNHNHDYYYKTRSQHDLKDPVDIAARFLYLNRTCYNGLYRVNKKGEFNVPMGRYKNPDIRQEDNIRLCHEALQIATIKLQNFDAIEPDPGDFVYFDPPYHPVTETSFTGYTKLDFTENDQIRLMDFARALHRKGVKVMLSNSNSDLIRDLYNGKPFKIRTVHAPRPINCKPGARNNVEEVLITSYG